MIFTRVGLISYKVILAGDASVGKTNLVNKYTKTNNESPIAPTVGV